MWGTFATCQRSLAGWKPAPPQKTAYFVRGSLRASSSDQGAAALAGNREAPLDAREVPLPVLHLDRQLAALQLGDGLRQLQLPHPAALLGEQRREVGAGFLALDGEVGRYPETLSVQPGVVVVHADEDSAQCGVLAGDGVRQRQ